MPSARTGLPSSTAVLQPTLCSAMMHMRGELGVAGRPVYQCMALCRFVVLLRLPLVLVHDVEFFALVHIIYSYPDVAVSVSFRIQTQWV